MKKLDGSKTALVYNEAAKSDRFFMPHPEVAQFWAHNSN